MAANSSFSYLITFLLVLGKYIVSTAGWNDATFDIAASPYPRAADLYSKSDLINKIRDTLVDSSMEEVRTKFRKRLSDYAEEVKAVHGLPSSISSTLRRRKRDTIEADTLSVSAAARKRRSYIGKPGEFQVDDGMNYVVKRVFQLQEPSFATSNITDLNYFVFNQKRYLVVVEHQDHHSQTIVYRIAQNWDLEELGIIDTPDATRVEVFEIENEIYILPTTLQPVNTSTIDGGSALYRLGLRSSFRAIKIQTIDTENAKSILQWTSYGVDANDGLMCVVPEEKMASRGSTYHVEISCYRWQGGYFDLNFHLPAHNPQALDHLRINSHSYLCIANYKDDTGSTSVHSVVYRYNHKKGSYLPFQNIRTNGARDCKFFTLDTPDQGKEHFLAIANYGHEDIEGGVNYNVKSFIFKFGYGRFVFFQSIVTLGAYQMLPIQYGETFVLMIAELHRLSIYQHNGWSFVKTRHIDFPQENLVNNFRMRPALHANQSYFTVASPRLPVHTGIHAIEFEGKNDYTSITSDFEQWCNQALENIQSVNLNELASEASSVPNTTTPQIFLKSPLTFTGGLQANGLASESLKAGDTKFDAERSKTLADFARRLQSLQSQKEQLKSRLDGAVSLGGDQVVTTPLRFSEWRASDSSQLETGNLTTEFLNGINVAEILQKIIFLNESYKLGHLKVDSFSTDHPLILKRINGNPVEDLVLRKSIEVQKLNRSNTFNGRVIARGGFNVSHTLNGVNVSNILTYNSDQHFSEMSIRNSSLANLNASVVNQVDMIKMVSASVPKNGTHVVNGRKKFSDIQANTIQPNGNVSGYNITIIQRDAIRTANISRSTFTGKPVFEEVEIESLTLTDERINGKYNLSDFVSTQTGNYTGGKWTIYSDAHVKQMMVKKSLNDIPVENGQLKVLLKNSSAEQVIEGHTLNAIYLQGPSYFNGTVNGMNLGNWSNTKTIYLKNPSTSGVIHGKNITFAKGVTTKTATQQSHDLLNAMNKLIPKDAPLPCQPRSIRFQSLRVEGNADVDKVNGQSPTKDWVRNDGSNVVINAPKTFQNNVEISQPSTAESIRTSAGKEIFKLLPLVLQNGTDQEISGRIGFTEVLRTRKVSAPSDDMVVLDGIKLSDILTTRPGQKVQVKSMLKSQTIVNGPMTVEGDVHSELLNGIHLEQVWNDTLKKKSPTPQTVTGRYKFTNGLLVNDMVLQGKLGRFTVDDLIETLILNGDNGTLIDDSESRINGSIAFDKAVKIKAAGFVESINGISADQWGNSWMTKTGTQDIYSPYYFNSLTVQNPQVSSDVISDMNIRTLNEQIIRKDQGGHIKNAQFQSDIIFNGDFCSPSVNGYNVTRDFLRKSVTSPQVVTGQKVFKGNWTVNGNLNAGNLEQVDWPNLVRFVSGRSTAPENLFVQGDCITENEPEAPEFVNGLNWSELLNRTWLGDRDSTIESFISFKSLHLLAGGDVDGLIDEVDVRRLENEYLSRTKDQTSNARLTFKGPFCTENLTADQVIIKNGSINGVDIKKLNESALKYGEDQNITAPFLIESLSAPSLKLNGTINGQDFCRDFIRIKGKNRMSAAKIGTIEADTLKLPVDVKVNGVHLGDWTKNAARTDGNYTLRGTRTFASAHFEKLVTDGLVNGKVVNSSTVLRTSGYQVGTASLKLPAGSTFGQIHLHGDFNGVNLENYFKNTLASNGSEPLHIYGPVIMDAPVQATWVQTEDSLNQNGVDVSHFLRSYHVDNYINNSYHHQSLKDKYEIITDITERLLHIASEHAVLAKCVREVPKVAIREVIIAKPVVFNREPVLVVVQSDNGYQSLGIWVLSSQTNEYVRSTMRPVRIYGTVRDIVRITGTNSTLLVLIAGVSGTPVKYEIDSTRPSRSAGGANGIGMAISPPSKGASDVTVESVLSADDFTQGTSFNVLTSDRGKRSCLVTGKVSQGRHELDIKCLVSSPVSSRLEFESIQRISLGKQPEISTLTVNEKTIIIWSDSNSSSRVVPQSDFIKVFAYNPARNLFVEEDCFPAINIISIDSILAPNYHPFLAVVSGRLRNSRHDGAIYIYRYSEDTGRFSKFQTIIVEDPIEGRFQRLEPSDELILYVLTRHSVNNIHVYSFKGVSGWAKEHSFTAERARAIETSEFIHHGEYRARLLASSSEGIQSFDWAFNGIGYIYENPND